MKIITVVGARPQFIKAAALSRKIAKYPDIEETIVHTGQHFEINMSDVFFEEMQIPKPGYSLGIDSVHHGAMIGRMLEKIEEVLLKEKPDFVIVYGDTNSTLAGALAARKLRIRVVHVEAGLRSFNMRMPEEVNRVVTDRISDILCCPTERAVENLKTEGFGQFPCVIAKTGDVMQDAALFYSSCSAKKSRIMDQLELSGSEFFLCTIHREENTDDLERLTSIFEALNNLSKEMRIVIPLHPRTRKRLLSCSIKLEFETIEPVGYFDMLELIKHTSLVLTDSGGLQKEAFFFSKPCVTLRNETEWVELVEIGANRLAGTDAEAIIVAFEEMKREPYQRNVDLYGGGNASRNIVELLCGK